MRTRRSTLQGLAAGALALARANAWSQDDKSAVTLLIGANGSMDAAARLLAEQLRESLGRPVIVSTRLGAGQRLALLEARRAAPDGRTLVFSTSGPFSIYPNIYRKLDYDPVTDFTPIAGVSSFDVAIATGPQTGATDLRQLVQWCRTHGDTPFGTPGNGSLSHFVGISMGMATGVPLTHVAYKDIGVAVVDLASGRLPVAMSGLNSFVEMHKAGRIRVVAVSGEARSPQLPDVPTLKEGGVNVGSATSTALLGPRGMPPDVVAKLYEAVSTMQANPAVKDKLAAQSMTLWAATPQQVAASFAEERKRFEMLVKASGFVREEA
ncbi:MAG: ABC transporter substrate-binding protein [Microbacteriaceae bacterium]|nr:ABC transporter substrate-binding protein [Burkholderiaceae bacterium]